MRGSVHYYGRFSMLDGAFKQKGAKKKGRGEGFGGEGGAEVFQEV